MRCFHPHPAKVTLLVQVARGPHLLKREIQVVAMVIAITVLLIMVIDMDDGIMVMDISMAVNGVAMVVLQVSAIKIKSK